MRLFFAALLLTSATLLSASTLPKVGRGDN